MHEIDGPRERAFLVGVEFFRGEELLPVDESLAPCYALTNILCADNTAAGSQTSTCMRTGRSARIGKLAAIVVSIGR